MRGKQGSIAERRRAVENAEQTIDGYQAAVRRLTAERDKARSDLEALRKIHAQETRVLRAQRDAGSTPFVDALTVKLESREVTIQRLKGETAMWRNTFHRSITSVRRHLIAEHGMTWVDSWAFAMTLLRVRREEISDDPEIDDEEVRAYIRDTFRQENPARAKLSDAQVDQMAAALRKTSKNHQDRTTTFPANGTDLVVV